MGSLPSVTTRPAPFQALRIHRLLGVFLLGHLLILPLLVVAVLAWLWLTDILTVSAEISLFFSFYDLLAYLLVIWLIRRSLKIQGLPLKAFFGPPACLPPLSFIGWGLMLVVASFGLALPNDVLLLFQNKPIGTGLPDLWLDGDLPANVYNSLELVTGVLLAPVAEELLFRGIFLHRLTVKWNLREAIVISSLIFGLLHGLNLGAVVFGLLMSLIYLQSGSLRLTICFHSLHNALIYLLTWLIASGKVTYSESVVLPTETFCLAVSGVALLFWFYKYAAAWDHYPPFLQPILRSEDKPEFQKSTESIPPLV